MLKAHNGQMVGWAHKYKRRYCTLWFWRSENLASSKIRRKQSNGKRSTWCLYASYVLCAIVASQASVFDICIGVGLSALLVSDGLGNARAFRTWNGQQNWLHAFCFMSLPYWIIACRSQKRSIDRVDKKWDDTSINLLIFMVLCYIADDMANMLFWNVVWVSHSLYVWL